MTGGPELSDFPSFQPETKILDISVIQDDLRSRRSVESSRHWSHNNNSTPSTSSGILRIPQAIDPPIPCSQSSLMTTARGRPCNSRAISPDWNPVTTTTGSAPRPSNNPAARLTRLSPPSFTNCLGWPSRREDPAASNTPASLGVSGFSIGFKRQRQTIAVVENRVNLGRNGQGNGAG